MPLLKRISSLAKQRIPGQIVIQMTDHCNASCPQCGMRQSANFLRSRLSVDAIKRILDTGAEKGIEAVSFTGGEPLLFFNDVIECIRYASNCGIKYTRTGTNGFLFMNSEKKDFEARMHVMAEKLVSSGIYTFWISLDSAIPEVHEGMRGLTGVVQGIERAIPIFAAHGLYPSANLGINRNIAGWHKSFDEKQQHVFETNSDVVSAEQEPSDTYSYYKTAFSLFYQRVIDMGFSIVNACYPMSSGDETTSSQAVYRAISEDDIVSFRRSEKIDVFRALFDTIPLFRNKIRIFSPRSSLLQLIRDYSNDSNHNHITPCRGGIDFFYIDAATGNTYPCGYRAAEPLGDFQSAATLSPTSKAHCTRCDWECFRDPSVMFDPVLMLFQNPFRLLNRVIQDTCFYKTWLEDILYYRKCHFFDGQKAWQNMPPGQSTS